MLVQQWHQIFVGFPHSLCNDSKVLEVLIAIHNILWKCSILILILHTWLMVLNVCLLWLKLATLYSITYNVISTYYDMTAYHAYNNVRQY